ncbi:MAG: hypothetical protein AAF567_17375 [Actinomycetota bacterium]
MLFSHQTRARLVALLVPLLLIAASCSVSDAQVTMTDEGMRSAGLDPADATTSAEVPPVGATPDAAPDTSSDPAVSNDETADGEATAGATDETALAADPGVTSISFEPTPEYLAFVAETSGDRQGLRFEQFIEMTTTFEEEEFRIGSRTQPFVQGDAVGERVAMRVDFGGLAVEGVPAAEIDALGDVEIVSEGSTIYVRGGFIDEVLLGTGAPALNGAWAHLDLTSTYGEFYDLFGGFGVDGAMNAVDFVDALDDVGEILPGGASEVRGVPTEVVYANVDFADFLDASQIGAQEFGLPAGAFTGALPVSLEVHIDADHRVRRIAYRLDLGALLTGELGDLMGEEDIEIAVWTQTDFFDYDAVAPIELPVGSQDITEYLIGPGA